MARASDTREVLIAEALGDFVKVLDRIDAVKPTLERTCSQLKFTADRLMGDMVPFQKRILTKALETQNRADAHIAEQADHVFRNAAFEQIAAMQVSARRIFENEVVPPLERIAGQLREANLREQKQPTTWDAWLTHAAVAVVAASCTCMLMLYFAPTGAGETRAVASAPAPGYAMPGPPPVKPRDRR